MTSRLLACAVPALLVGGAAAQQWVSLSGPMPIDPSAAFDLARGRLVLFDGVGQTWEVDGNLFLHRPVNAADGTAPPARSGAGMAYDAGHRHTLLFGGTNNVTALRDTWSWDGAHWTQLTSLPWPQPRAHPAMTFDLMRNRVVMFGGSNATLFTDTWEHDGANWIQQAPATTPLSQPIGLTFDLFAARSLMLTTSAASGTLELWEWNGIDWLQRQPAGPAPRARERPAFVFDLQRQRAVVFGGDNGASPTPTNEIWEWDGNAWSLRLTTTLPTPRQPVGYHDVVRGRCVFLGGYDAARAGYQSDAWSWDGQNLAQIQPDRQPVVRYRFTWAADDARGRVVMFGGTGSNWSDDTWEWDGLAWNRRTSAVSPSPREGAAAVFDSARGHLLLFGGQGTGGIASDLWAWDGSVWRLLAFSGPSFRREAAMAFDAARGCAVLFGGVGLAVLGDTWEWSGTAWQQRTPLNAPSSRMGAAMAWDPLRQRTVLFGGGTSSLMTSQLADTWEWDGTQWLQRAPATSPPALLAPSLAFDPALGRVVLTGTDFQGSQLRLHVWDYDGTNWSVRGTVLSGGGQNPIRAAFQSSRQRLVAYDGLSVSEWTVMPTAVVPYGAGCGGAMPFGASTRARVGAADFGLEADVGPNLPVVFALSPNQANVPLGGGCTLLLGAGAASVFALADATGLAHVAVPIPLQPALRGLLLSAQAGSLDAGGALRLSVGLHVTVGD